MIKIRTRANNADKAASSSTLNAVISEVESVVNRLAVTRSSINQPINDYLMYDKDADKLYLKTIEGDTKEITLT